MSVAACSKEVHLNNPPVNDHRAQISSFHLNSSHDSLDLPPYSSYHNSRASAIDSDPRNSYAGGRLQTPTPCASLPASHLILQSPSLSSASGSSALARNHSIYPTMNYSSAPASFGPATYAGRDHSVELKNYSNDTRGVTEYMRVDFNSVADTLNFASNTNAYDALHGDGFGNWSASPMDTDGEMKARLDFRAQTLSASNACPRLSCPTEDYRSSSVSVSGEQLYAVGGRRMGPAVRNQEIGHFDLLTSQREQLQQCLPTFETTGYSNTNGRAYDSKLLFNGGSTNASVADINAVAVVNLARITEPNANASLLRSRSAVPSASNLAQASETSITNSVMMTPDSSTTGFLTNKFGTSSDDGEISPTPTNSSGHPRTPGRMRKVAPTLATGRRNLKSEPVDADEADRRMKRRERNRKSAQKCRERKVQRTQELQSQVECLQMEINRLTQERDNLRSEARQFVTLLQVHCPGVAIPYMSCLDEGSETVDTRRDNCGLVLQTTGTTTLKVDGAGDHMPTGWRMKQLGKVVSTVDTLSSPGHDDPFSHLPTMVPMQSHLSPTRCKSIFTFSSSDSTEGLAGVTERHLPTTLAGSLGMPTLNSENTSGSVPSARRTSTTFNRGPASASSSSSCSGYEHSFPVMDTPMTNSSLINPLEDVIEGAATNSTSVIDQSAMVMNSPKHTQTAAQLKSPTLGNESLREEWDQQQQQQYYISKQLINEKTDPLSPVSPSIQLSVYTGPIDSGATIRCDIQVSESQQRPLRSLEEARFFQ
ncbi:hypothetical protein EG68_07793 [Paragonimus skrjabini miyazakii]|uniref:BZIP domain-containing protein n=1 Tax=Paragonimus skrjabini miyazakii TaxID=59628 RepID=A0A8S9YQJ0_9TREM|nr:hypothetical protein EG68_07793 [Paragonimus skrjabini miyazakii]